MYTRSYSRKQAGVVYAASKRGDVNMTREAVALVYDCIGEIEVYDGRTADIAKNLPMAVHNMVDAIFAGDYATAQVSADVINEIAA